MLLSGKATSGPPRGVVDRRSRNRFLPAHKAVTAGSAYPAGKVSFSVGVASGCDSPNAPSTRSRTHSPGVTPRCAASASSFAYSSSVSFVPTDRVRRPSPIRRFYKLPAATRPVPPQHPRRGDVSPLHQPPSGGFRLPFRYSAVTNETSSNVRWPTQNSVTASYNYPSRFSDSHAHRLRTPRNLDSRWRIYDRARKLKTADGGSAVADCLVAKWADDELTRDFPCARQPCLHRIFAECPPDPERILSLAGRYGLLTVSIPRTPAPGQIVRASALPPEPVEIWRKEIQALRACMELWDSIAGGQESATARERRQPQNLRAPRPRAVLSEDFRARFPVLSGNFKRRSVATLRRRSRRSHSPRPLLRAQLWPLVPPRNHCSQRQTLLLQRRARCAFGAWSLDRKRSFQPIRPLENPLPNA